MPAEETAQHRGRKAQYPYGSGELSQARAVDDRDLV